MDQFSYAILRATPDPIRGERVNIGLVVFLPDRLDVRLLPRLDKLLALDPNVDLHSILGLQRLIPELADGESGDQERHMLLAQLGIAELTQLGRFALADSAQYEQKVAQLLQQLVSVPSKKTKRAPPERESLAAELRRFFRQQHILGASPDEALQHRVIENYTIAADQQLVADFALKNGRWNFMAVADLRNLRKQKSQERHKSCGLKAVTLDQARRRVQGCVPIAIWQTDEQSVDMAEQDIRMLKDYAELTFDLGAPGQREQYFKYVLEAAGVPVLPVS